MILENENIKIECLPSHGGKLSSIYDKKKNFELLFQNPKEEYKKAELGAEFSAFEACGFDDAFPNIDSESIVVDGKIIDYPDHGEVWTSDMKVESANEHALVLSFDSKILPYHYEKAYFLTEKGLSVIYKITNTGDFAFPCFYTFHCLVNNIKDAHLLFPKGISKVLMVDTPNSLKDLDDVVSFPITENGIDLTDPSQLEDNQEEKYYVMDPVSEGFTGYQFPNEKITVIITYKKEELPYLGFWNTQGHFRGDYNFALEMCNGYYDSISTAQKNKRCPVLKPGEVMKFSINIRVQDYN
jgi:galactose mutarotase-like enzyme